MVLAVSIRISRVPTYSGFQLYYIYLHVQDFHLLWYDFPDNFHLIYILIASVLQPPDSLDCRGLGYSPFDRHYLGNHFCFIVLRVLRCFNSPGLLSLRNDTASRYRVAPFGNLRLIGYLHLTIAYRRLPRPSSPPAAKASTL